MRNSGRALSHVAVVYSLQKVGEGGSQSGDGFDREVAFKPMPGETTRVVAFIEKPEIGRVWQLGQARQ